MLQEPSGESSGSRFTPLVVLELASDTKEEAIAWLLSRIRDREKNGGVEVHLPPLNHLPFYSAHFNFVYLHQLITNSSLRALYTAS